MNQGSLRFSSMHNQFLHRHRAYQQAYRCTVDFMLVHARSVNVPATKAGTDADRENHPWHEITSTTSDAKTAAEHARMLGVWQVSQQPESNFMSVFALTLKLWTRA